MSSPPEPSDVTRTAVSTGYLLPPGHLLADRYRIRETVGVGGMGFVYRARDERLDVDVAVKVLRPELAERSPTLERFRQELLLARRVTHKRVVRIHDLGHADGLHFLTMDYVPGRTLGDLLDERGRLSPERAAGIGAQVATALAAAHREEVVHRDLKPGNVLLDAAGSAYVTDFGVARSLTAGDLTRPGSVVGTLDYLAPEQARGEPAEPESDLFALGLLLFEMLAGEPAYPQGSPSETLARRISGRPRKLAETAAEVPPELAALVDRLLEHDPERRPASADEVARELARMAQGSSGSAAAPRGSRLGARLRIGRGGRRAPRYAAVVLAVVALLAVAAALFESRTRAPAQDGPPARTALRHSVAVLPFADETGRPELAWLGTGLAERLGAALGRSPELAVADGLRTLATFEDLHLDPGRLRESETDQLFDLLDADRLVAGRLRLVGDRLRVETRLLAREEPGEPPSIAREGPVDEVYALVDGLAGELSARLEAETEAEPSRTGVPRSAEALAAYGEGLEHLLSGASVEAAPALERAVEADPAFAAAWLRLAEAYERLGHSERALAAAQRAVETSEDRRLSLEAGARAAALAGDPERAAAALGTLVARYPGDVEARVRLAETLGEQGRHAEAEKILAEVVAGHPDHPRAWYLRGKYAILSGYSRAALDEHLVHALVIQNRLGNVQGKADVVNAMGVALQDLQRTEEAIERYSEAARLRREVGDLRGFVVTTLNLATLELRDGRFATARASLEEARGILEEIGDEAGLANLEHRLGVLEERQGRFAAAREHYRASLAMRRELGDRRATAESHDSLAFADYVLGDYVDAEAHWRRALELYRGDENREGTMYATQNLGFLAVARGQWEEATEAFLSSLETSRELGLPLAEVVSLAQLGRIARLQGRHRAAVRSYEEALELVREVDDPRGVVELSLLLADAELAVGRTAAAAERLERARRVLGGVANAEQEAELARIEGDLALATGSPGDARAAYERAQRLAERSGSRLQALAAELGLARADLAAGRVAAARERLGPLAEATDRLGHLDLELATATALAEALGAAGEATRAAEVAGGALVLARSHAPWHGAFRLHAQRARALEAAGDPAGAARERAAAAEELERLRAHIEAGAREAFDDLPEVAPLG